MAAKINVGQFAKLGNGTKLHYVSAGEAGRPLILFVHGFPEFWYEWAAQLPEFGEDHLPLRQICAGLIYLICLLIWVLIKPDTLSMICAC